MVWYPFRASPDMTVVQTIFQTQFGMPDFNNCWMLELRPIAVTTSKEVRRCKLSERYGFL